MEGHPSGAGSFSFPIFRPAAKTSQDFYVKIKDKEPHFSIYLTKKTFKKEISPTFQNLVIAQFVVRHFSQTENFPHQHSKGPHVGLGGVIVLEHRLCWQPAQRDPRLSVVVILTAHRNIKHKTHSIQTVRLGQEFVNLKNNKKTESTGCALDAATVLLMVGACWRSVTLVLICYFCRFLLIFSTLLCSCKIFGVTFGQFL